MLLGWLGAAPQMSASASVRAAAATATATATANPRTSKLMVAGQDIVEKLRDAARARERGESAAADRLAQEALEIKPAGAPPDRCYVVKVNLLIFNDRSRTSCNMSALARARPFRCHSSCLKLTHFRIFPPPRSLCGQANPQLLVRVPRRLAELLPIWRASCSPAPAMWRT